MGTEGQNGRPPSPGRAVARLRDAMSRRHEVRRAEDEQSLLSELEMLELDRLQSFRPGLAALAGEGEVDEAFVEAYLSHRRRSGAPADVIPESVLTADALEPRQTHAEDPMLGAARRGENLRTQSPPAPLARGLVPNALGELCGVILERAARIAVMRDLLRETLRGGLPAADWHVQEHVIVDGIVVPFLVIGPTGITAIWVNGGDIEDDQTNEIRLSQIARRGLERRLPDGRPVVVWHWTLYGENARVWRSLPTAEDDGYWIVTGGEPCQWLLTRTTKWPLPGRVGEVVRAASRAVAKNGQYRTDTGLDNQLFDL